nr:MAG TPA: hypothetical protein [Caudoviricetes sp.]
MKNGVKFRVMKNFTKLVASEGFVRYGLIQEFLTKRMV